MDKKIITIVEIVFAMVFVMIMALLFKTVTDNTNKQTKLMENLQESITNTELQSYDGTRVSGDTVRSVINKMESTENGIRMSYYVVQNGGSYKYGYKHITDVGAGTGALYDSNGASINASFDATNYKYETYNLTTQPSSSEFISPVVTYESKIVFNVNGAIIGIMFTEV